MWLVAEVPVEIHPADAVPRHWLVYGASLLALAIALPLLLHLLRRLTARGAGNCPDALDLLRRSHLEEVEAIIRRWREGQVRAVEALGACSASARSFVGVALDLDLDVMTLHAIEQAVPLEPRLRELAVLLRRSYPMSFADTDGHDDVDDVLDGFRTVVSRWT